MICLTVCEVTAMCCHVLVFMFTCFWSTALVNHAHILRCPGTAFWVTAACYIVSTWANAVLYGCGALHNTGDPFIDSGLYIKSVEAHTGPGRGEYCRQGCWYKIASSFYFSMYTQNNLADCSTSARTPWPYLWYNDVSCLWFADPLSMTASSVKGVYCDAV